jgi:hypothetical protein
MSRKVGEITCGIIFGSLSISELILIPSMTIKVLAKNIGIRFCYQGYQNRKKKFVWRCTDSKGNIQYHKSLYFISKQNTF